MTMTRLLCFFAGAIAGSVAMSVFVKWRIRRMFDEAGKP